jgi:hypothetical protein
MFAGRHIDSSCGVLLNSWHWQKIRWAGNCCFIPMLLL